MSLCRMVASRMAIGSNSHRVAEHVMSENTIATSPRGAWSAASSRATLGEWPELWPDEDEYEPEGRVHEEFDPPILRLDEADEDEAEDEWLDCVSEEPDMVTRRFMISRKVGRMV
jgi:hypothetical protein